MGTGDILLGVSLDRRLVQGGVAILSVATESGISSGRVGLLGLSATFFFFFYTRCMSHSNLVKHKLLPTL